ncbi:MAG: RecX family transcriptional regulator, partial [Solobacterium sp.]|nr:RecX family transcriptional regulator [Solobacterium sp.]
LLERYHVHTDIHIVPTGLELDRFSPEHGSAERTHEIRQEYGIADDEKMIVSVGRIAEEKSLDIVIEGFRLAAQAGCRCRLLIVGGGPDEDKLKKLVQKENLADTVIFAGKKPADQIADYYRASDAFVSASLSETQGMTFIEAMASGIPLFARYDEVLDELLIPEKTGWFYKDPQELSQLLQQFEKLPEETLEEMKNNCLAQVHPFSSEVFYERIIPVYEKALGVYTDMQTVEEVRVRDDFVQIWLRSEQGEETRLLMSLDDYYYQGIRKGGKLSGHQISKLQENEPAVKAYQGCLRRIAAKDRTRKEIIDWLRNNSGCSEEVIIQLADKLESKGYINDERYTEDAIRRMHAALRGEKFIIHDLEKRGIPAEMIRAHLAAQPDQEYENARDYAERIQGGIRDDSVKMKQRKIKNRLMQHGYSAQVAEEVLAGMDFSEDEMKQPDALRKCAAAACRRYARKYSGSKLRSAVYRYCAGQGYPSEDIYAILDEMEWDHD